MVKYFKQIMKSNMTFDENVYLIFIKVDSAGIIYWLFDHLLVHFELCSLVRNDEKLVHFKIC